jgi:hypothetical protein
MKTIQLTIDDDLLDRQSGDGATTNLLTLFIKESLIHYLHKLKIKEMEKRRREGYSKQPIEKGEFDVWEGEQVWST